MGERKARTLHDILEGKEPLPPEQAIPLALDLYRVLESMHKQGKVLGGIYPDQVLLEEGMAQIFELAAPRLPEDVTLSYLGFVPPEILSGQAAVLQSDIYSAGIILYVLLTGRIPYAAGDRDQLIDNVLHSRYENFPQFPEFPQLEWILKKCMNGVASRRFATAQELSLELRKVWKPMRAAQGNITSPGRTVTAKKLQRQGREYQRILLEHWKIVAAAGGALLLIVLVVLLIPEKIEVDHSSRNWNVRQLTSTPDTERDPSLSPDGQTIAFVSRMTGNWEIYIRGFSGGEQKQVTETPGSESHPRWSPDGQLILFTYEGPGSEPTVFSVPPTGGIPQKVVDNAVDAQWSADGKSICYVTPAAPGVRSLEIFDVEGLSTRSVLKDFQGLAHPTFSADGKKIACEADSDQGHKLFLVDTKSGKMKAIPKIAEGYSPTWDWSTGWIYFTSGKEGSRKILRTDPGGFTQEVTTGAGTDFRPFPSANGSRVLFFREDFDRDVFRIDPLAPLPERVSPVPSESALPRSLSAGTLLFVQGREPKLQLQTSIFGGSVSTVMESIRSSSLLSISPDGSFVYVEDPQEGKKGLWQVGLSGNDARSLGEQMAAPYEISPDRRKLFYAVRKENSLHYMVKDLKTLEESELFSLPAERRVRRASWLDNGSTILFLTADKVLSTYSIKDAKTSNVLDNCHDFSLRPHSDSVAALVGPQLQRASLVVTDLRSRKHQNLTTFDPEMYAVTLDWSRDGSVIYYDRYKAASDLFVAE